MNENDLILLLNSLNRHSENEILELKEAKDSFRIKDLGKYFSALSNEANLRGASSAFLVFGVQNDGKTCGTSFRREAQMPSKGLQKLKKEIAENTNNRITFREIYEIEHEGKRVIVFDIPAATRGIPTQWAGAAWAREDEDLVPLPISKIDEIRRQPPADWSRQVVEEATLADLDPEAISIARKKMRERYGDREGIIDGLDDSELLDKAGITFRGKITHTALLLLGRPESAKLIAGSLPKITWSLYEATGTVRTYQHFDPPFLLRIDDLMAKIRNEEIRLLADPDSLIPLTTTEYDDWSLRELVGNAIAHQAYDRGGKVNIEEFPDRISFLNEGGFIPGSLEKALEQGYKPPFYRNPFLVDAMLSVRMLDQNAMGIRTICEKARERDMPLPTYDLSDPQRVRVDLPNHEINPTYTHLLFANPDLPILTVLALDKAQKGLPLDADERADLTARGFIEGDGGGLRLVEPRARRAPSPSSHDTAPEGKAPARLLSKRGLDDLIRQTIIDELRARGAASRVGLTDAVSRRLLNLGALGADLKPVDGKKIYRLLRSLEEAGVVRSEGNTRATRWMLV